MAGTDGFSVRFLWEAIPPHESRLEMWAKKADELGELINSNMVGIQWAFGSLEFTNDPTVQRVMVRLQHPAIQQNAELDAALCELSTTLLGSDLAADLQRLCPTAAFNLLYPIYNGGSSPAEKRFMIIYTTAAVTHQCGGAMCSRVLGKTKDNHHNVEIDLTGSLRFRATYSAADVVENNPWILDSLTWAITKTSGVGSIKPSDFRTMVMQNTRESAESQYKLSISQEVTSALESAAIAASLESTDADVSSPSSVKGPVPISQNTLFSVAWTALPMLKETLTSQCTSEVKLWLKPKIENLEKAIQEAQLQRVSQAYMDPNPALRAIEYNINTRSINPQNINKMLAAIGNLKQSMALVFDLALITSDNERAKSKRLKSYTGVGSVLTSGPSSWMYLYGATATAWGALGVTGLGTTALGVAAIRKTIEWNRNQPTNPTNLIFSIIQSFEAIAQPALYLLSKDPALNPDADLRHLAQVEGIETQLSSRHYQKPEYWQAFTREEKRKIEKALRMLKPGFERLGVKGVLPYLDG